VLFKEETEMASQPIIEVKKAPGETVPVEAPQVLCLNCDFYPVSPNVPGDYCTWDCADADDA
jgi:hypothetical protein